MSTEEQSNAFNEVRAILGKLDRSIDEARSRRLEPDQVSSNNTNSNNFPSRSNPGLDREVGAPAAPVAKTELQKKGATFGRAKPLNQSEPAQSKWKSTGTGDDQLIG